MIENLLKQLSDLERQFQNQPSVMQSLEQKLEDIALLPAAYNMQFLLFRNHFRVKHAAVLKKRRPRILVGLINYDVYPNFQIIGLLLFGDIVSLSLQQLVQGRADRLAFDILGDDLSERIKELPKGFEPDYYWDPQICGISMPPLGLERLPFPTVAGICHTFRGVNTTYIARLYDVIAPISKAFVELYSAALPDKKVIDIPFGGNWGSFHLTTSSQQVKKDIDLVISFGGADGLEYGGYRNKAITLAKAFKEKYQGKYKVEFVSGVSFEQYSSMLARSKIGLNVVGFNGPYNYRSCELINNSVALMQMNVDFSLPTMTMADYLIPLQEYIPFDEHNFEEVLVQYLADEAATRKIAQAAKRKLERDYSYQAIQQQIFNAVIQLDKDELTANRLIGVLHHRNWLTTFASAPHNHTYKHKVFALHNVLTYRPDDEDSIRRLLISLPELEKAHAADLKQRLTDPQLLLSMDISLMQGIAYLSNLIPAAQRRITDDWTYYCYMVMYCQTGKDELKRVQTELKQLIPDDPNSPDLDYDIFPLSFNVPVKDYDAARKRLLDIPYSLAAGNPEAYRSAVLDYMIWWCEYFLSQPEHTNTELMDSLSA